MQNKNITAPHLIVVWEAEYPTLVSDEWNPAINTYFTGSDDPELKIKDLSLPVQYTIKQGNALIKDNITGMNSNNTLTFNSHESFTFTDLQNLINGLVDGDTLTFEHDYNYSDSDGNSLKDGINITKSITVDFNDHILDGSNVAHIFNIASDNVVLKNATIENALPVAITWIGDDAVVDNLTGNNIQGTVIDLTGYNPQINNIIFNNCNGTPLLNINGNNSQINRIEVNE